MVLLAQQLDWKEIFNYGLPTALLFIVGLAIWRVMVWAKAKVVEPVVDAHVRMMNTFSDQMPKQTSAIEKIEHGIDTLNQRLAKVCQHCEDHEE